MFKTTSKAACTPHFKRQLKLQGHENLILYNVSFKAWLFQRLQVCVSCSLRVWYSMCVFWTYFYQNFFADLHVLYMIVHVCFSILVAEHELWAIAWLPLCVNKCFISLYLVCLLTDFLIVKQIEWVSNWFMPGGGQGGPKYKNCGGCGSFQNS